MQITIEYAAQVKRAAGAGTETLQFDTPPNLQDVVQQLTNSHGDDFRRVLLDDDGNLHPSVLVFVGDNQIRGDWNRPLSNGDVVSFLSPISGG